MFFRNEVPFAARGVALSNPCRTFPSIFLCPKLPRDICPAIRFCLRQLNLAKKRVKNENSHSSTIAVRIKRAVQCLFGQNDGSDQCCNLNRADQQSDGPDTIFTLSYCSYHRQSGNRQQDPAADFPYFPAISVCKLPGIFIFHGPGRTISV